MTPDWADRLRETSVDDVDRLERVLTTVDDLAATWHALPVGGSLRLQWPRSEPHTGRRRRSA